MVFCKENNLPASGGKLEITDKIAHFLDTGKIVVATTCKNRKAKDVGVILEQTKIESDFVCSEKHRIFFKQAIGKSFTFHVPFQKWLKTNTEKTYREAIFAYYQLLEEKKRGRSSIDQPFEYNAYIRGFFTENPSKRLEEAIKCWKYKKSLPGHNRYELADLIALNL